MPLRPLLLVSLAALLLAAPTAGCARFTNPATGKSSYLWITPEQEQQWGRQVFDEMQKKPGFLAADGPEQARLEGVTRRLVQVCDAREWNYQIRVLKSSEVNAFAAPGGYVFATQGLMKLIQSDDELAGVMAHELGHVAAKHTAMRMQKAMIWQGVAVGAAAAATMAGKDEKKSSQAAAAAAAATMVVGQFVLLANSREDEYQADKLGVAYSHRGGYNPEGLVTFFRRLEKMEKKSGGDAGGIPAFFSTHPSTPDRIARVEQEIANVKRKKAE
ncbi:MAG TPA: M48 family metallopeptidase [Planctomycetota bacterium]|nr:M48 family metallopeptidase [Planctomycetota bacterium]